MVFINDEIKKRLDAIFIWYTNHKDFVLYSNGVKMEGTGFDDWFSRNREAIVSRDYLITTESGAVVYPKFNIFKIECYKGDILVRNNTDSDKYSPASVTFPVIYYYRQQLRDLLLHINNETDFTVSCSELCV